MAQVSDKDRCRYYYAPAQKENLENLKGRREVIAVTFHQRTYRDPDISPLVRNEMRCK
jgi:hypothetical protein